MIDHLSYIHKWKMVSHWKLFSLFTFKLLTCLMSEKGEYATQLKFKNQDIKSMDAMIPFP